MNENNYKKAMDSVCDKHFNLTAEEMLEIAKVSADTERNITMKSTTKRIKSPVKKQYKNISNTFYHLLFFNGTLL